MNVAYLYALNVSCSAGVRVRIDNDSAEDDGTLCNLEPTRHLSNELSHYDFRIHSEHRMLWPDHTYVRNIGCALR